VRLVPETSLFRICLAAARRHAAETSAVHSSLILATVETRRSVPDAMCSVI
jgi:hypothetical protein